MYYSEYARIRRIEKWLERLAYISVGLDFFIALASFLVLRGTSFSTTMLTITGDLMMFEMVIIGVLFAALVGLKHYGGIIDGFARARFRNKYRRNIYAYRKATWSPLVYVRNALSI